MTYVHSRPDFIELHVKTFDVFLEEEYEYVVFNDAPNDVMCKKVERTCKKLGVKCFRIDPRLHNRPNNSAGHRHMDAIQYSLDTIGYDYNGVVLMVDADMFLIKPFSVKSYMGKYNFIGGYQERADSNKKVMYSFPGLVFMNMKNLPNKKTISFEGGEVEGIPCDVGGHTHYYFKNNPHIKLNLYTIQSTDLLPRDEKKLLNMGFDENSINYIFSLSYPYGMEFHADGNFLHYYAGGSNWPEYSADFLQKKTTLLNDFINKSIKNYKQEGN